MEQVQTIVAPQARQIHEYQISLRNLFDPQNVINLALSSVIYEQMKLILRSRDGWSIGKISRLIAIMSLNEIRKLLFYMTKKMFAAFGANYTAIFRWINEHIFKNILVKVIIRMCSYIISFFKPIVR